MLLYEIHMPIIMLAELKMASGNLSTDNTKREMQRAIVHLKLALEMLKWEPDGSVEKNVYHRAKESLAIQESFLRML